MTQRCRPIGFGSEGMRFYHLLPALHGRRETGRDPAVQQERAQSSSSGPASGLAWLSNIWDLSTNIRRGEVRMDCRLDYFPIPGGDVPTSIAGWSRLRTGGVPDEKLAGRHGGILRFHLLMLKGNPNCDNYASSIAQAAGIGTSAGLAQRVPIQIPVLDEHGRDLGRGRSDNVEPTSSANLKTSFPEPDGIGPLASASD